MKVLVSLLRFLPPEVAHSVALNSLNILHKLGLISFLFPQKINPSPFFYKKLTFQNKLGIAAGLDKNGDYIDSLGSLGFGFIEVGTVTPLPQPGNQKPRIFRFVSQKALINRLGFNNKGVDYLVKKLKSRKFSGIVGVNIGSNKNSKGQKRIDDYVECIEKVSPYADYITVNISSPNTPNLRALHSQENLIPLFSAIQFSIQAMNYSNPIFIKISPDIEDKRIGFIIESCVKHGLNGLIISNTSKERSFELKSKNIDKIACIAVNDIFVMDAWAKKYGVNDEIIMLADGNCDYTRLLGLENDSSAFGMGYRSKRYVLIAKNGIIKTLLIDNPGDIELSTAESLLSSLGS